MRPSRCPRLASEEAMRRGRAEDGRRNEKRQTCHGGKKRKTRKSSTKAFARRSVSSKEYVACGLCSGTVFVASLFFSLSYVILSRVLPRSGSACPCLRRTRQWPEHVLRPGTGQVVLLFYAFPRAVGERAAKVRALGRKGVWRRGMEDAVCRLYFFFPFSH